MFCFKCGAELSENAKFCHKCGLKIIDEELVNLVIKMQEGESDAFEIFYNKTVRKVKATVESVSKTNTQEVEDIVQEIYLTVYQKIGTLNNPEGVTAWLKSITRNVTITYMQKKDNVESNRVSVDETDEEGNQLLQLEDTMLLPEDVLVNKERQQTIHKMLEELPEMQYKVMMEYYFSGKKIPEISEQLGVHTGTVKSYLSKARDKMQQKVILYQKMTGVALRSFTATPVLYVVFKDCVKRTITQSASISILAKIKNEMIKTFGKNGKTQILQEAGKRVIAQSVIKTAVATAAVGTVAVGVTSYVTQDERAIKTVIQSVEQACQTLNKDALGICLSEDSLKCMKNNSLVAEYVNPQVLGYDISARTDFSLEASGVEIEEGTAIAYCTYIETEHDGDRIEKSGYITFILEEDEWKLQFCRMNMELFQTGGDLGNIRFPELILTELVFNDELER